MFLRTRAVGPERTLARVCREAGATVRTNNKLCDMNVAISASDAREKEVLASGLPMHHGAQLAVDITMRSALTANGSACPNAAHTDGAVLLRARSDKEGSITSSWTPNDAAWWLWVWKSEADGARSL